jgi:adenylate kinase
MPQPSGCGREGSKESSASEGRHKVRLILLGPPGAGKGTQAKKLSQALGVPHVASGDLFREHQARGTELGILAASYMRRGVLVPDEVVIGMVLERLAQEDCRPGVVLDGFPRTREQAQALDRALGPQGINEVLHIVVSPEELVRRLSGRLLCRGCQTPYQRGTAPQRCTLCGGELYQREDDQPLAVRKRIEVYAEQTAPLVDYYRRQGKLRDVDGEQSIEAVTEVLQALVESRARPAPISGQREHRA